jgi:hypothetical protein
MILVCDVKCTVVENYVLLLDFFLCKGSTGALFCGAAKIDQVVQPRARISLEGTAAHCHVVRG